MRRKVKNELHTRTVRCKLITTEDCAAVLSDKVVYENQVTSEP
jgi:hypothetical protein